MNATTRTVRITWVEAGTNNAAMLGLDETIESSDTLTEIREAALNYGDEQNVDLDRYDVVAEETEGAATQTKNEIVKMILGVMRDGQRSDRYLRRADDGHYYTTPDLTFLSSDGERDTPPYASIPVDDGSADMTPEDRWDWAASIIDELDEQIDSE